MKRRREPANRRGAKGAKRRWNERHTSRSHAREERAASLPLEVLNLVCIHNSSDHVDEARRRGRRRRSPDKVWPAILPSPAAFAFHRCNKPTRQEDTSTTQRWQRWVKFSEVHELFSRNVLWSRDDDVWNYYRNIKAMRDEFTSLLVSRFDDSESDDDEDGDGDGDQAKLFMEVGGYGAGGQRTLVRLVSVKGPLGWVPNSNMPSCVGATLLLLLLLLTKLLSSPLSLILHAPCAVNDRMARTPQGHAAEMHKCVHQQRRRSLVSRSLAHHRDPFWWSLIVCCMNFGAAAAGSFCRVGNRFW